MRRIHKLNLDAGGADVRPGLAPRVYTDAALRTIDPIRFQEPLALYDVITGIEWAAREQKK
jgi:hypothetical protein